MEHEVSSRTITYTNTTSKAETIYSMHDKCRKKIDDVPNVCDNKKVESGKNVSFTYPNRDECYLVKVITKGYNYILPLSEDKDEYFSDDFN